MPLVLVLPPQLALLLVPRHTARPPVTVAAVTIHMDGQGSDQGDEKPVITLKF